MTPKRPTFLWRIFLSAALSAIIVAGCGTAAVPPPPTRTPAPTFTPTAEIVATPVDPNAVATALAAQAQPPQEQTPGDQPAEQPQENQQEEQPQEGEQPAEAPTDTPAPAPTPAPATAEVVINQLVNIRNGPGTNYGLAGSANPGQRFTVTGKNQAGDWWQIDFNGQAAWVYAPLVTPQNTEGVAVALNIPAAPTAAPQPTQPPAAPTPAPQPTATPAPQAPAPQVPASNPNTPYDLVRTERCDPNPGVTYFSGFVRDSNNNLVNAVCVHIYFYEPRTTKCSGCDGVGDGIWGFSPFGGPAPKGTSVEIYVVECPAGGLPLGGQSSGFGNLTPLSPKFTYTVGESTQCTGITFVRK